MAFPLTPAYIIIELTLLSHHFELNDAAGNSDSHSLGTCHVPGNVVGAFHF